MNAEVEFVQFHPSYDYTDFVEGLRPQNDGSFKRTDGVFKAFCQKAVESWLDNQDKKFVIIIDEINRGEISKIFGELFFSIDPDYRVKKGTLERDYLANQVKDYAIQTQYQNLSDPSNPKDYFRFGFFIPDNLYIIGTMNDIDRSVESLDFAMRRRFTFVEFFASDHLGMLDLITDNSLKEHAKLKMNALNKAIVSPKIGNLSMAYQVGGAYFANINKFIHQFKQSSKSEEIWDNLWNYSIKGLVYEYFRGQPEADKKVALLKDEYDKA